MSEPLLSVKDLSLSYRTRHGLIDAVRHVSFTLSRGERLALVGESGSGKSTIASTIVGLQSNNLVINGGSIRFGETELLGAKPRLLNNFRGRHIGFVPQDPSVSLNPVHRIGDQVAEVLKLHGLAGKHDAAQAAVEALAAAGIDRPEYRARQYPHELSGGMRQRVLIAIGVVAEPSLLIADEPTSALDVTVQHKILNNIDQLTSEKNLATLLITHDLGVAAERSDRIIVLSKGHIVEDGTPAQILEAPEHPYTRQLISDAPSLHAARRVEVAPRSEKPGFERPGFEAAHPQAALELVGISKQFSLPRGTGQSGEVINALTDVSVTINKSTTYGLVGESGSGKTTLGRIALRLEDPTAGHVILGGEDITEARGKTLRELRRRIQVVQQNPYASLNPRMTIAQNIYEPLSAFGEGNRKTKHARALELLDQVMLPSNVAERTPEGLSGGQRQRVAIARALALSPEVLILDEPVSALDVTVQAQILDLLVDLQKEHDLAYLFISHDLAVVRDIAHEVGVIRFGELVEEADAISVFERPQHEYTQELLGAIPMLPHPSTVI
ncbi:dipeptide ABC transporter ATPase [Corynebacterium suranareeae]|uniref:Dipeptide ABC transporter ATPase n=1 Tax=Corynebacterium suranareeae TaxID=2506452 RepID=A0A160PND2_9CORY|nr:ABC transporter ATP-binding protein [Corynebacterium suranareeae]BAU94323.1 dipeptide ABC transporter ATPase [Corynebacterium suranareeae]